MIGYLDPEKLLEARTFEITERFIVMSSNVLSNPKIKDKSGELHRLVDEFMDYLEDWQM